MGRKKIYNEREIALAKLWHKLARSTFAIVDYDVYLNKYKPKINDKEVKKLVTACSLAIRDVLKVK